MVSVVYAETAQWTTYQPQGQINATSIETAYGGELINVVSKSPVKRYMDYTAVTDTGSKQYQLLRKGVRESNGLIKVDGYVCVALGSRYGAIGDKFTFILRRADGTKHAVKVIKSDAKQDRHTIGGWTDKDGNILEMIVDTDQLPSSAKASGDCDQIQEVSGEIIRIVKESNK